LDSNTAGA